MDNYGQFVSKEIFSFFVVKYQSAMVQAFTILLVMQLSSDDVVNVIFVEQYPMLAIFIVNVPLIGSLFAITAGAATL